MAMSDNSNISSVSSVGGEVEIQKRAYNAGLARVSLNNFIGSMSSALKDLDKAYADFMTSLKDNWGSPRGARFARENSDFRDIISQGIESANNVVVEATNSVDGFARKATEGRQGFSFSEKIAALNTTYDTINESFPNGDIGIKLNKVMTAKEDFKAAVETAKARLDAVAASIPVYDGDGKVQNLLTGKIGEIKASISDKAETMTNTIDTTIEDYKVAVNRARSKALSIFSDDIRAELNKLASKKDNIKA